MKAGILADIILGESPHLKGLARHFNLIILDSNGNISGFNAHLLKNINKREDQVINQRFAKYFDCDEGKANLMLSVRSAFKGKPCSVQFNLLESKVTFTGVILPIYDHKSEPNGLIIIAKEEHRIVVDEEEIEDFWIIASKMIEEAGISSTPKVDLQKPKKPKIMLVEDQNGLIIKIFKHLVTSNNENILIAPSSDSALILAEHFQPNVVISHYYPIGHLNIIDLSLKMKNDFNAGTIFLSNEKNEIRIEDGWLDIHVKNHPDSVSKILELINQLYW